MEPLRLDEYASLADAPTALPFVLAPKGSVFRGMSDLSDAVVYANQVCKWFTEHGSPQVVFVVRGPTSTSRSPYEVVDASCGYTIAYKAHPVSAEDRAAAHLAAHPELDDTQREILLDTYRSREAQEHLHATCLHHAVGGIRPSMGPEFLSRCEAFLERRVACIYAHERGENTSEKMWQRLLEEYWPSKLHDRLLKLTVGYLKAGYMDMNQPVRNKHSRLDDARLPLDVAIRKGYSSLVGALIEAGVDISKIPEEPVQRTPDGPVLAQPGDILAYIQCQTHTDVDGMLATAKGALMKRVIASQDEPQSTPKSSRRLRAV